MVGEQVDSHSTSDYERVAELHAGAAVFNTAELFQAKQVTFGSHRLNCVQPWARIWSNQVSSLLFSSLLFCSLSSGDAHYQVDWGSAELRQASPALV